MTYPLLSLIVFTPFLGALFVMLLPSEPPAIARRAAFVFSLVPFVLSLEMLRQFDPAIGTFQMTEKVAWIPNLGVYYSLGVDGFSLWLIILTTLLTPVVILAAWGDIVRLVKEFMGLVLFMEGAMLGALVAVDLFLFFVFWELMIVPFFFVIGVWGGPRRRYATIKFVLYTMVGSALMFVGMIYLVLKHAQNNPITFDIVSLYKVP